MFATPHSKNPVKSSVPSYLNVNLERSDNEEKQNFFELLQFQKEFSTPQDFGSGEFFGPELKKLSLEFYISIIYNGLGISLQNGQTFLPTAKLVDYRMGSQFFYFKEVKKCTMC